MKVPIKTFSVSLKHTNYENKNNIQKKILQDDKT